MSTRIDSVEAQVLSLRNEMNSKFEGLDYRFESINIRLDSIDKRIPVIEELTALKIKMADIEKRLAVA